MLSALLLGAALCGAPLRIPAGPVHIEPQCSHSFASVASHGDRLFSTWSMVRYLAFGVWTGSISGGALDERGALREPLPRLFSTAPAQTSVAMNGERVLIVYANASQTFAQFVDADGQPLTAIRLISNAGFGSIALWNGTAWLVVANEGGSIVVLTLSDDAGVASRRVLAADAGLPLDAVDGLVLLGNEVVTFMGERHRLPEPATAVIHDGDGYLIAWKGDHESGVRRLNAHGQPTGERTVIAASARELALVSMGDDTLFLWGDGVTIRAATLRDGKPFDVTTGALLDAAATPGGAIVLVSRGCGVVTSIVLPGGEPHALSVAPAEQTARAVATTSLGTQVFWSEYVPTDGTSRLYATFVDTEARAPILLNTPGSLSADVEATPMRDGTAAAWVEYTPGRSTVRAARFDALGRMIGDIVTVTSASDISFIAITANDASIVVVSAEKAARYDVWATRLSAAGAIEDRTLLASAVEGMTLDAAMSSDGVVASWFDYTETGTAVRAMICDPQSLHIFPKTRFFWPQDLAVNDEKRSMLVWLEQGLDPRLHALFSDDGLDVEVAQVTPHKYAFATADREFRITWAESDAATTVVKSTANAEVCYAIGNATLLTTRDGALDALVTHQDGRVVVAKPPRPRRRAVR